jgi:hypothetical protein
VNVAGGGSRPTLLRPSTSAKNVFGRSTDAADSALLFVMLVTRLAVWVSRICSRTGPGPGAAPPWKRCVAQRLIAGFAASSENA